MTPRRNPPGKVIALRPWFDDVRYAGILWAAWAATLPPPHVTDPGAWDHAHASIGTAYRQARAEILGDHPPAQPLAILPPPPAPEELARPASPWVLPPWARDAVLDIKIPIVMGGPGDDGETAS
jgi:hypothetical protein